MGSLRSDINSMNSEKSPEFGLEELKSVHRKGHPKTGQSLSNIFSPGLGIALGDFFLWTHFTGVYGVG